MSGGQSGVKFKRQRPINNFIVDFFSQEIGLIIEIDGSSHLAQGDEDKTRQNEIESIGYTFLRFSEGETLNHIDDVKTRIVHAVGGCVETTFVIIPPLQRGKTRNPKSNAFSPLRNAGRNIGGNKLAKGLTSIII